MNRNKSFDWLDSVGFFDMNFGLDRMLDLLDRLKRPQDCLHFVHVAGSNGKGSVCTLTENALRSVGLKTGFYSSPHLIRLAERFKINGVMVSDSVLESAGERVRPFVEVMRKEGRGPTYFEITTAIALELFRMEKVDFVVWETGLGGRLDATNVVIPDVSVITGISLEHTEYLGSTLSAIAGEKAGIVKKGRPVVCGPMPEEAFRVIRKKAEELDSPFYPVRPYDGPVKFLCRDDFTVTQSLELDGVPVNLNLAGAYQRNNAATAAMVVRILSGLFSFDRTMALSAFSNAVWPARFQFIPGKKMVMDGAHNPEGAEALAGALKEMFPGRKFHFIAGCFADKNAREVLRFFGPLALDFQFIAFDGSGRKVTSPTVLGNLLPEIPGAAHSWREVSLKDALASAPAADGEWTVLSGSLHLCGEALSELGLDA